MLSLMNPNISSNLEVILEISDADPFYLSSDL
jgi:hypothetical protein